MFCLAVIIRDHVSSCERLLKIMKPIKLKVKFKTKIQTLKLILTFRGPCIVMYSYNKSQRDALFLKFILVKNSTCFGQIYCPSSGVLILYSQQ